MRKDSAEKLSGNDQFEGYAVDLTREIARVLGFNYSIRLVPDGRYGSFNKDTGEWDGMVRELLEQRADLAVGDLTITFEREGAVDFTMPFMNLGISVLYRKPLKQPPNLFSFLSPLSLDVWIYMATAYLGVSLLLFILARWEHLPPLLLICIFGRLIFQFLNFQIHAVRMEFRSASRQNRESIHADELHVVCYRFVDAAGMRFLAKVKFKKFVSRIIREEYNFTLSCYFQSCFNANGGRHLVVCSS